MDTKKLVYPITVVIAVFIGVTILFLANGNPFSTNPDEQAPVEISPQNGTQLTPLITASPSKSFTPTFRPTLTTSIAVLSPLAGQTSKTPLLIPETGSVDSQASKTPGLALTITPLGSPSTKTPTLSPEIVMEANPRRENKENVLLLTVSNPLSNFAPNFLKLAQFYGLGCKQLALDKVPLTEGLLRKEDGQYYRLIVLDASELLRKPSQLSGIKIQVLRKVMNAGGVHFLIAGVNEGTDPSALAMLTGQAVVGVSIPVDYQRDWIVSAKFPELTQVFTGQKITAASTQPQQDCALQMGGYYSADPIITSTDMNGKEYTILGWIKNEKTSLFVDAAEGSYSLDVFQLEQLFYSPTYFSQFVPFMLVIRYAMGDEAWHADQQYANLTIDEGILTEPFGNLNYSQLLLEMEAHNFHTSIALPPINYTNSRQEVIDLFLQFPDRYSLVQYGNNNDGYEFYRYTTPSNDPLPARPFNEQDASIRQGLTRMQEHQKMTGIPFDQVMIFPDGISPELTFLQLKRYNYLAAINSEEVPLDSVRPSQWDFGLVPANMDFANFPSLIRRAPGTYKPFTPDLHPFIMDLFLGKPALFSAYQYELFDQGINTFDPVADQMNQLSGGIEWKNLGYILTHLYLEKTNDDQSIDVKMFTSDLILTNTSGTDQTYHISKAETWNVSISKVLVNDESFNYRVEDGQIKLDARVPANSTIEIEILYK